MLKEDVGEFVTISEKDDLAMIADALAVTTYVYGTALTNGIDLDSGLRGVPRSNMSKLSRDGSS